MSVFQAVRKIELEEIKLDPDFQRNLVWDEVRQSRLIESVLLKIPLPAFYLDALEPENWVVVDGLQRLSTLDAFMRKKTLRLTGLEFLGRKLDGMRFDDLPRSNQRDLEETQLTMYVIRPETPPEVKFTIFHRINTGGMVLTAQEIRHATFPGRAPQLLKRLAACREFKDATLFSVNPKRMDDRECVLRHLAFRISPYPTYKRRDLNEFLGSAMSSLNAASEAEIHDLSSMFKRSMNLCREIFGQYAFRKFDLDRKFRGPVNKALFETWSTAILDYPAEALLNAKELVLTSLDRELKADRDYLNSLSLATGGLSAVQKRFNKAHQILAGALNSA